jgi:pimeloyl-ACP methyl ester carboxylesterase
MTFTVHGGSGNYTWSLSQNQSGATLTPSGSTCLYTAGAAQGTDILHVADTTCGQFLHVTVKVQALQPQVTESHFCPPTTNGAGSATLYATFNTDVDRAETMELPSGSWTGMSSINGLHNRWAATMYLSNPTTERQISYAIRGTTYSGALVTPIKQDVLYVTPNGPPILLVHGWTLLFPCTDSNECQQHFQLLAARLASDGYDARVVPGIGSWVDASANAETLRGYIEAQSLQNKAVVLVGYSFGGLIIREFLNLYPTCAAKVKAVVTIDTPHAGSAMANIIYALSAARTPFTPIFGLNHAHDDFALPWLVPIGSPRGGMSIGRYPNIAWYELASKRLYNSSQSQLIFNAVLGTEGHDEIVTVSSQRGFGAGASNYHERTDSGQSCVFLSPYRQESVLDALHNQILQDDGGTEFTSFYAQVFQPVIQEILPLNTASCTPGLMAAVPRPQGTEAQAIPSATQARVVASESGTATAGVEAAASLTIESTLQATFGVSLSGGTGQVWLTDPTLAVITPGSADGDSIKYDFMSGAGTEQHVYTLRSPAAGAWTIHVLPSATDPGGLSYTLTAQSLSTLGMSASASPGDLIPGDAVVVSATLLKTAAPVTDALAAATLTLPDGANAWLTLYDDGLHQDGAASDGVYGDYYTAGTQSGPYTVTVNASGTDGSLGAWQRVANTSFAVGRQVGTFTGTYSESAPDADLNGKFDALVITAEASAIEPGDYRVMGDLKDQAGKTFSSASGIFAAGAPGSFSVALSFRGQDIFENSALGPYTLTNLRLYKSGTIFSLSDRVSDAYTTTGSYPSWMNFESKDVPSSSSSSLSRTRSSSEIAQPSSGRPAMATPMP